MNAMVKQDQPVAATGTQGDALLAVISRVASDPNADVEKMERLMAMYERAQAQTARAAFDAAMADMQSELPTITERGAIKDRNGNVQSHYAKWEDVNAAIKPVMQAHGFALSFRTDFSDGVTVVGVLSHAGGHREETSIKLPSDTSGSKNAVQAIGSSVSYGKRYTAGALLNLTSGEADDDGVAAGSKLDSQALDWIDTANDLQSIDDYHAKKSELLKVYGGAGSVPRDVIGAFNRAFNKLKEAAK